MKTTKLFKTGELVRCVDASTFCKSLKLGQVYEILVGQENDRDEVVFLVNLPGSFLARRFERVDL